MVWDWGGIRTGPNWGNAANMLMNLENAGSNQGCGYRRILRLLLQHTADTVQGVLFGVAAPC